MKRVNLITIVSVGALAVLGLAAFQNQQLRIGIVDMAKVAEESKLGKRKKAEFDAKRDKMSGLLQFLGENRYINRQQAMKLRELMLLDRLTPDQEKELNETKAAAQQAKAEMDGLLRLPQPTQAQLARISELRSYADELVEVASDWNQEFSATMNKLAQESQGEVLSKVRLAVAKVGKRDGYTVVLESGFAPYGANDATNEVLKVMDADNP